MLLACSRLAMAQVRTSPQDRIVDAVVGMEALLLAGHKKELRFRFALHYATLFEGPDERLKAFKIAKDLYDFRSGIAHGGSLEGESVRVGNEWMSLKDAAERASEALRFLVGRFLPDADSAPYKRPEFWEGRVFGLEKAKPE